MGYENVHKNLTPAARKRGRDTSLQIRRERQNARIAQVQLMRLQGLSKAEIARKLKVSDETIRRDCETFENDTPRSVEDWVIDAIFLIVRNQIAGTVSAVDARQQAQDLIGFAIANASNIPIINEEET